MVDIDFNEPSEGQVNSTRVALEIKNNGSGGCLKCITPGTSNRWVAVWGETESAAAVVGLNKSSWVGVHGICTGAGGHGVIGEVQHAQGGAGVIGTSINWVGVYGESKTKIGVWGKAPIAGFFEGDVEVTGDIRLLNADCAEDFDIADSESKENVEAGTVMVLTENGSLQSSYQEYDKKVAGIISGASGYKPAIVLDRQEQQDQNKKNRLPIALMGKVFCKVDARHSSIEIGDLLTTSSTKGYAMKAQDPMKAFGAVIGKALGSIKEGMGLIPVLVSLQ